MGLPVLCDSLERNGKYLPCFVKREFEKFLSCGDPREGFAWLWCRTCDEHKWIPFSCKGRGFCPSCGGRRMNAQAMRWVDDVFPKVATRQWVMTVPWGKALAVCQKALFGERCAQNWTESGVWAV